VTQVETEVKNDNITANYEKKPHSKVAVNIQVSPQATQAGYFQALKAVNKGISLPGFRKGKAPDNVIATQYPGQVKQEWRDFLVRTATAEAIGLLNLNPLRNSDIRMISASELSKEKGLQFSVEFEIPPVVPKPVLEHCVLKEVSAPPITEEDVNGVINNVRYYFAKWEDVHDRPVQEGDFVDLDIIKLDEPQETICEDARFLVQEGQIANWMRDLIVGLNVKESVEGTSEQETLVDPSADSPAFIPTRCRITVKAIRTANLPELTDEFANKVGAPSMAQLRERVISDLRTRSMQEMREELRLQVNEWLLKNYPFDVPESMVINEAVGRLNNAAAKLQQQNVGEKEIKEELEALKPKIKQQAEDSCRLHFLLMEFAKQHNVQVTQQEFKEAESQGLLQRFRTADPRATTADLQTLVAQAFLLNKTRDYIIQYARYEKI